MDHIYTGRNGQFVRVEKWRANGLPGKGDRMTGMRSWFAVQVKTGREREAKENLERQGVEVYLPTTLQRISHARKVSWQERAFLPGYVFVNLAPEQRRWTSIRSTRGVVAPVHFGGHYPILSDDLIALFRCREDENGHILLKSTPKAPFAKGQRVRVISGPMADLEGLFQCMRGEDRALVLMHLLQRHVYATMNIGQLAAA